MTVMSSTMPVRENAWAGQGAVLLDIGGDVGALVVQMPGAMVGLEVEIRPLDGAVPNHGPGRADDRGHGHHHLAHVAVVARPVADGRMPCLVFGDLSSGRYELFEKGCPDDVALRVDVTGGAVTTADWPQ
jgi:hypothetical protein